MNSSSSKSSLRKTSNQLRIIGGRWRGRKLSFPSTEGLRPTPDRVRETLFNWLAAATPESRCLDLFAGSGALGLEALSRGAAHVDFVDNASVVVKQLQQNLQLLKPNSAHVWLDRADSWLAKPTHTESHDRYDIIFLDPPFHRSLVASCLNTISEHELLNDNSWVYLEMAKTEPLPALPSNWQLHREKIAGQVCYRLFAVNNP
jgi:16S rRNA (guanine966-N2)-methyltransferase